MIASLARLSTFSAFRYRDFRLYWTGNLVSLVGTWMQTTAQSYLVWELTRNPLATSLPILLFSLPSTLLALVGGVAADRVDRRKLLLGTQTAFTLQAALLAGLTLSGHVRIWEIYLLALINGTVLAFDSPARQSLIPSLVERDVLTNAIALNSTAYNASRVFGPPLAGILYAVAGPGWCFALNAISYFAVLYSLWIIRPTPGSVGLRQQTRVWEDVREGIAYVRSHALTRTILQLVALVGTFGFTHVVLMPVMASTVLGGGPAENGYLLGAVGLGATLGALSVATMRSPRRPGQAIVALAYAGAASLMAFAFSRHLLLSLMLSAAVGGTILGFLATANSTIQSAVPDALRGRVMSIYSLALIGSGPLNSLVAGVLGNFLGAPGAIALSGLVLGVMVAVVSQRNRPVVALDMRSPAADPSMAGGK